MEDLLPLIRISSSVVLVFSTVVGVSIALERMSSPEAKADLSRFLRSTDFSVLSLRLPKVVAEIFDKIFGPNQFSVKCIERSAVFSINSILFLLALGFITHPGYFWTLPFVLIYQPGSRIVFGGWIILSLFIDFVNLYKTRLIIRFGTNHRISVASFIAIFVGDVLLAFVLFVPAFWFLDTLNIMYQVYGHASFERPAQAIEAFYKILHAQSF
jgi:hypothetical protein